MRPYRLLGWSYVAISTALVVAASRRASETVARPPVIEHVVPPTVVTAASAAEWFRRVKPYCNSVEVATLDRRSAPLATVEGAGYHAGCLALAGKIDGARRVIDRLPDSNRLTAVAIVFEIGHPVADMGDDRSAGPIMELVVDYWPNHYMALYHAGMSEYMLGQRALAAHNLRRFLDLYAAEDGWRSNALDVLRRLRDSTAVEADPRRPREPGR
jgi:hypothetical protein